MTDRPGCETIRERAAELALGVISGDERAEMLDHLARCPECRKLVLELSSVGDQLLSLAPSREPSVGFESRVISALNLRRGRARRGALLTAAVVLAAAVGGGGVWLATREDRGVAARYQQTLDRAGGEYFAVWDLETPGEGKVGNVFGYEGHPSWVFVTFEDVEDGTYTPEIETASGRVVRFPAFEITGQKRSWGTDVDMELHDIAQLRMVGSGSSDLISVFGPDR